MNFKTFMDQRHGGLRGYLAKSKQVQHPGAHGSHAWYIDRNGEVVYGDRPLPTRPAKVAFEENGHYFHPGRETTYMFTPHGEVHGLHEGEWRYVGHVEDGKPPDQYSPSGSSYVYEAPHNILEGKPAVEAVVSAHKSSVGGGDHRQNQRNIVVDADYVLADHYRPKREAAAKRARKIALEEWAGPADPRDPTEATYVNVTTNPWRMIGELGVPIRKGELGKQWHGKKPGETCDFCGEPFDGTRGYGGAFLNAWEGVRHACSVCEDERYDRVWAQNLADGTVGDDHDYPLITKEEADEWRRISQEARPELEEEAKTWREEDRRRWRGDDDDDEGPYTG